MVGSFKPATITKGSFAFCRISIATILWIAVFLQNIWLVGITMIIMLFSTIFRVKRAPLVLLWKFTFEKIRPSKLEIVDERGIFVSHLVGTLFSLLCIGLIIWKPILGWIVTVLFAILQTSAAFGFCSALKLYTCLNSGTCCRVGKKIKETKDMF